ncbi:MAG: hypothetical protein Q4D12_07630 [Bacteroidales bacterium]|nr:hypothetical protein [Bacteroidales bacterium]
MKILKTLDKTLQQRALDLALHVFMQFEASEYSDEGIEGEEWQGYEMELISKT